MTDNQLRKSSMPPSSDCIFVLIAHSITWPEPAVFKRTGIEDFRFQYCRKWEGRGR